MALANTAHDYGGITRAFHWLTALLILTAIPLGLIANAWPYDTSDQLAVKAWLFSLHKTVGVTVFFVALLRIAWAVTQPKPGLLHPDRRVESWLAGTMHWLLYASLVIVPLSGWLHHAASTGFAPIWWPFGQSLPFVPKDPEVAEFFAGWHFVFTKVLGLAVVLHIAGALKHHFVDRDATLARMLPGRTDVTAPPQHHSSGPVWAASGVYVAAILAGSAIGLAGHSSDAIAAAPPAEEIAAAAEPAAEVGNWTVQEGTIGLSMEQFGQTVSGSFGEWSADIAFSEEPADGVHGSAEVIIRIPSLTLGSVTSQAMGSDFFAAEEHPQAVFSAQILPGEESDYVADGTLTIRGNEVPVSLPFTLSIDGDTAEAQGSVTLDRRDFSIGSQVQDPSQLGYEVDVSIDLTATRGEGS